MNFSGKIKISDKSARILAAFLFVLVALSFSLEPAAIAQNANPLPIVGNGTNSPITLGTGNNSLTNLDTTTGGNIRNNYQKRFPFAQAAWNNDVTIPVKDGLATLGIDPTNRMRRSAPGTTHHFIAYIPFPLTIPILNITIGGSAPPYKQKLSIASDTPATMRDGELFNNTMTTFGLPMSDTQFQIIDRENKQRFLELLFDPERAMWAINSIGLGGAAANSLAGGAESSFDTMVNRVVTGDGSDTGSTPSLGGVLNGSGLSGLLGSSGLGSLLGGSGQPNLGALINIANESNGQPLTGLPSQINLLGALVGNLGGSTAAADKTIPQAVWMVQQMYKFVFVPMAILFLLPGAVITQMKGQIAYAFKINQDDNSSPFEGILRAMIAVFLIPATQLIVSYAIDVGNSMCYSVGSFVDVSVMEDWANQLTYNIPAKNDLNAIEPPGSTGIVGAAGATILGSTGSGPSNGVLSGFFGSGLPTLGQLFGDLNRWLTQNFGSGGSGLGSNQLEGQAIQENQLWLSQMLQLMFNACNYLFSLALIILSAFQLVIMCYLFLLGPLRRLILRLAEAERQSVPGYFR